MAFLANQLHQVAAIDDAAAGNPVPVLPAPGVSVDEVHGGSARASQRPSHMWFLVWSLRFSRFYVTNFCFCTLPHQVGLDFTSPCHQAFFHSCSRPGWSQRREKNYCLRPCCSWQAESWHSVSRLNGRLMPHKLQANKETMFREASMNKTKYNYEAEYY